MSGRHVMVEVVCEKCGELYLVRRTKFNAGLAKYCSKTCYKEVQREVAKELYGYEKGTAYWDGVKWSVHWYDEDGKVKTTSYQKWWWQNNVGEVPKGMFVYLKDGNNENVDPSNFAVGTRYDIAMANRHKHIGKVMSQEAREKLSKAHSGKKLSEEHRAKLRKTAEKNFFKAGRNNIGWRGGASQQTHPAEFSKALRKHIYERDGGSCRICSEMVRSYTKRVHHINANKDDNREENLILLCSSCHGKIHATNKISDPVILAFRSQLYT